MRFPLNAKSLEDRSQCDISECWPTTVTPEWVATVINQYTPLVQRVANSVYRRLPSGATTTPDDLMSDGLLGLLLAIQNFKPDMGAKFSTYAFYRIKGSMFDSLRRAPLLTVPRDHFVRERAQKIVEEERCEGEEESVGELLPIVFGIGEEVESTVADNGQTPLQALIAVETESLIRTALDQLSKTEREVMYLRYVEGLTLRQIARKLKISRQTVLNVSSRAERRLRSIFVHTGINS